MVNIKKLLLIIYTLIILVFATLFVRFYLIKYFPHEGIIISLPFAPKDDDLSGMAPMGERVNHPNAPHGHPGIDFQWNHPVEMLATADVKVTSIKKHSTRSPGQEETWDVETVKGIYAIRYQEIIPVSNLKVGMPLKKGDVLGYGGKSTFTDYQNHVQYSVHWEFDYNSMMVDRLCPLTYFDPDSLARINNIWTKVGETFGGQFPDICSGDYEGKYQ